MLHKYSDNGKYRPNSSNNRPNMEAGVTPGPTGGERLLLSVPQDSHSSQSRSRHSRGMKGGRSSRSRGILPLPLPCKTLVCVSLQDHVGVLTTETTTHTA